MPDDVLAQFDIGLDLTRRDELELIGTDGKVTVADPWLCRPGYLDLTRDGETERLPADPDGTFDLSCDDYDAYRIEFDAVSAVIMGEREPLFGRADAVAQAAALEALRRSSLEGAPLTLHDDGA